MSEAANQWGIINDWRFEPVEIVKETEKTVTYVNRWFGRSKETRRDKSGMLDWRGDEHAARKIAERLTSAKAEQDRRVRAASDWFTKERAKILSFTPVTPTGNPSSGTTAPHNNPGLGVAGEGDRP